MAARKPWSDPQVGDVVVSLASGDGYGPARRREIKGLNHGLVQYDDGRYYTKYIPGEGWKRAPGAECVLSSWTAWCSKNAVEYRRGAQVIWRRSEVSR